MKKVYLLGFALGFCALAQAQDEYAIPTELPDVYLERVSPNGNFVMGQDVFGTVVYTYNVKTGETLEYYAVAPGEGNSVANDGTVVGWNMGEGMTATVMKNGKNHVVSYYEPLHASYLHAVTPDGRRATGYVANTENTRATFLPFVVDIAEDGTPGVPRVLPNPEFDFFGNYALYIMPCVISDDGKTIVGLVYEHSNIYSWPIIFREDENGIWSYSEPTKSLFNPNHEEIPRHPDYTMDAGSEPQPQDFIADPEKRQQYIEYRKTQVDVGTYWNFMTDEEYDAYREAHLKWADNWGDEYYDALRAYEQMQRRVNGGQNFGGIMHIKPDGSEFLTARMGSPVLFNVEDGSFKNYNVSSPGVTITQWLADGTLLGCTVQNAGESYVPYIAYIRPIETGRWVKVTDYLESNQPSYLYWLEDSILNFNGQLITGAVSFSDDRSIMSGGYMDGQGGALSYVFAPYTAGVEEIVPEGVENETFNVFNLNGVNVLTTKDKSDLNNLPKGIYIVNGKKIAI